MTARTQSDAARTTGVVIVAAGRGARAGGEIAKQWQDVAGKRVVDWTIAAFDTHPAIDVIALVVPGGCDAPIPDCTSELLVIEGGPHRAASVRNGLDALAGRSDQVLIHDVARPCVSHKVIDDVLEALKSSAAAAPAIAVTDALWRSQTASVIGTQPRDGLYRAQTPQGFDLGAILAAHQAFDGQAADDVEIARAAGLEVAITQGSEDNIKITLPEDFDRAAKILGQDMDIRTGNGFDVHRFGPGTHVTLCGVDLPHDRGLDGHSDADVALHTVTDAIYGALAEGDIGQHFPPCDPKWKGAASHIFLEHARDLAKSRGFKITHVDCTLICEAPKIGPHSQEMRQNLSQLLEIELERVSVKATTSERLGFTGRGEGIACMATASLVKS